MGRSADRRDKRDGKEEKKAHTQLGRRASTKPLRKHF